MTSGERMVWAVAFDRAMALTGADAIDAAFIATRRVRDLNAVAAAAKIDPQIDAATKLAVDDMLGVPR